MVVCSDRLVLDRWFRRVYSMDILKLLNILFISCKQRKIKQDILCYEVTAKTKRKHWRKKREKKIDGNRMQSLVFEYHLMVAEVILNCIENSK